MKLLGLALIAIAVALGITGLLRAKHPTAYSATALIKVERDKIDLPALTGLPSLAAVANVGMDNTYFIQTEIAVIQSDATFSQVITQLNLGQTWGQRFNGGSVLKTTEAAQLLKARLDVQPGAEVGLISIRATSDVAVEAAEIANATARAYCEYRADYRRRLAQAALNAVAEKYADLEKQIATSGEKVEKIWQQLDPALRELATANPTSAGDGVLRNLHTQHSESLLRYLAASNQIAFLKLTNALTAEIVDQLNARAAKAQAEIVATEAKIQDEMRRLDLLKRYQAGRFEFEELGQRFAKIKKTTDELKAELHAQGPASASLVEPATTPTRPEVSSTSQDRLFLPAAGIAGVLGIGLVLLGREPHKPPS